MPKPKRVPAPSGVPRAKAKSPVVGETRRDRTAQPAPPDGRGNEPICYRFAMVDTGGPWGFDKLDGPAFVEIADTLKSFETMTMNELFSGEHGQVYSLADLRRVNPEAYRRIVRLGREDFEEVGRLRLGGKKRLHGYRRRNVFYLLWWDPRHEVFPSRKKHT